MISVAICTANRGDRFKATLESLAAQTLPNSDFEILVIENGERSGVEAIAKDSAGSNNLNLRYFHLESPGLSNARNFGVKEARGEIVAFTDDDAKPEPQWLEALVNVFDSNPDAVAVGGPVRIEFETAPPTWLTEQHRVLLAEHDLGPDAKDVAQPDELLRGVNMAYRKSVFAGGNLFSLSLGRAGDSLLSGEDTEFQQRLLDRKATIVYTPEASVIHCLRGDRMTPESFRERFYWQGVTEARVDRMRCRMTKRLVKAIGCVGLVLKTEAAIQVSRVKGQSGRVQLFSQFRSYPRGYLREFVRTVG